MWPLGQSQWSAAHHSSSCSCSSHIHWLASVVVQMDDDDWLITRAASWHALSPSFTLSLSLSVDVFNKCCPEKRREDVSGEQMSTGRLIAHHNIYHKLSSISRTGLDEDENDDVGAKKRQSKLLALLAGSTRPFKHTHTQANLLYRAVPNSAHTVFCCYRNSAANAIQQSLPIRISWRS